MALVRILVDGYSLLHAWPDLAPAQPILTAKSSETKQEIARLIRGKGVSDVQLARLGIGSP